MVDPLSYESLVRLTNQTQARVQAIAARCSGRRLDCQVEGLLPSHDQPRGLGL